MATRYAVASGDWSDASNVWSDTDGGLPGSYVPVDGDTFVIRAGVNVKMDVDQSSWTGLAGENIIRGGASPGMLYFSDGDNGYLKLRAGATLVGTLDTNRGRLLANGDGVWRGIYGTTVTGSASTNKLSATSHGLSNGTLVSFFPNSYTDVLPAPLEVGEYYYVVSTETDAFQVSLTSGGAAIDLTTDGTGTFGVNTCLVYTTKATLFLSSTAYVNSIYLDIVLVCQNPRTKYLNVYGSKYTFNASTGVSVANNTIDLGETPPSEGTSVVLVPESGASLPAGLILNCVYYIRTVSGNTCKLAGTNADATIFDITAVGSGTINVLTAPAASATDVKVLQDVTSDLWTDGDRAVLSNITTGAIDQQRLTVTITDADDIVLSEAIDSTQTAGVRLCLVQRNISVLFDTTTANTYKISYVSSAYSNSGVFQCEFYATAGSGTTFYGRAVCYGGGHVLSGSVGCCDVALHYSVSECIVAGVLAACQVAIIGGGGGIVSALGFSCYNLFSGGSGFTYSGVAIGCYIFAYQTYNLTVSGSIVGGAFIINAGANVEVSGTLASGSSGVWATNKLKISGTIAGCTTALANTFSDIIITGSLKNNTYVIDFSNCANVLIKSGAIIPSYDFNNRNVSSRICRVSVEDYGNVMGAHKVFANFGDIIKTACDGTGDAPSQDPDGGSGYCVEASNIQTNITSYNPLIIIPQHRIWLTAGTHTITYKVQTTYSSISAGGLTLSVAYISSTSPITRTTGTNSPAISTRSSAADWTQQLSVTITTAAATWVDCEITLSQYESGDEVYIWPTPVIS